MNRTPEELLTQAAVALEEVGIVTVCNSIPYDPAPPYRPNSVRLGTPSLTTVGLREDEMRHICKWITSALKNLGTGS